MSEIYSKKFYEKMYAENRVWAGPQGILGFVYKSLKRFELHRVSATVTLLSKGNRILDIGCGDGGLLSKVKNLKLFNEFYGIDIAGVVVRRAKRNIKEKTGSLNKVFIKTGSLDSRLNFNNGYFDSVTCLSVLEHIFDPYFGIKEIHRLLKNNGLLILEVPNLVWLPRRTAVLFGVLPVTAEESGWDGGHLHYFTFAATKKLLEDNGFKIAFAGSTGIFYKIRNIWASLLGGNIFIKAIKVKNV